MAIFGHHHRRRPPSANATANGNRIRCRICCRRCRRVRVGRLLRATAGRPDRPRAGGRSPTPSTPSWPPTQRMAQQLEHVGQVVGRRGQDPAAPPSTASGGAWGEMDPRSTHADRRPAVADQRGHPRHLRRGPGRPAPDGALDVEGRPLEGEFLRSANIVNTMIQQLSVFTSEVTRVAREVGTDGKLGGQAQVRDVERRLEGPHRERQLDGVEPHRAGAQHRRGDHRRRQRRPVEEDHRRRPRRDPGAQGTINTMVDQLARSPRK